MAAAREAVYGALFNKLAALQGAYFSTVSRRLKHWTDCTHSEQPALYMTQVSETISQTQSIPRKLEANVELYVYTWLETEITSNTPPTPPLNALLDAIETVALAPDSGLPDRPVCTLGGLVQRCWIDGDIEIHEGTLGAQTVAVIPVRILVV